MTQYGALVAHEQPFVVLLPTGSVEPHGPHLSVVTDALISEAACEAALPGLGRAGVVAAIAPTVPYGVTECAQGFSGAVSVSAAALTAYLRAVVDGLLGSGADHVCLVNNHLEPAHDQAVRETIEGLDSAASVACPLTRRWARTLSPEFKSGQCHAGRYETSIVMAYSPEHVVEAKRVELPAVAVSLSDELSRGVTTFADMGMDAAYAGAPAAATVEEGKHLIQCLAAMVVAEVTQALAA